MSSQFHPVSFCMQNFSFSVMAAQKEIVWVEGYDAFKSFIDNWAKDNKGNLFVYFSGSKDLETGISVVKLQRH